MRDILYIVMPAYNEEENIEDAVNAWYHVLEGKPEDSRLIVADSGSTDGTHEILCAMQKNLPQLELLTDTRKEHGPKVLALYRHAKKNGAAYIFQTDSDNQTDPDEFPAFWEKREAYDGIFGNRTVRGDGKARDFVEKVVCLLLRVFFAVSIPDANAPFRLMRAGCLERYLKKLPEDYNIPNIMLTTYFVRYGEKTEFIEISFKARRRGENSIQVWKITKIGWKALKDFAAFRRDMQNDEHRKVLWDWPLQGRKNESSE